MMVGTATVYDITVESNRKIKTVYWKILSAEMNQTHMSWRWKIKEMLDYSESTALSIKMLFRVVDASNSRKTILPF